MREQDLKHGHSCQSCNQMPRCMNGGHGLRTSCHLPTEFIGDSDRELGPVLEPLLRTPAAASTHALAASTRCSACVSACNGVIFNVGVHIFVGYNSRS
jgi:hypothetical protein